MLNASSDTGGLAWTPGDFEVLLGTAEICPWFHLGGKVSATRRVYEVDERQELGRAPLPLMRTRGMRVNEGGPGHRH
jgi:hypothetical protein